MMKFFFTFGFILFISTNALAFEIRLPKNPTEQEKTASEELTEHIFKMTGVRLPVKPEGEVGELPFFYIGNTSKAPSGLSEEAWMIRSIPDGIILAGGGKRGTLYAVSHYLEDFCDVRWWNPMESDIPKRGITDLPVKNIDSSGKPAFEVRTIYATYVNRDSADKFLSRLRLSNDSFTLSSKYGGRRLFGSPGAVHTFWEYTKDVDFNKHPEWFSLIGGKRVKGVSARMGEGAQLCLTNPELRKFMLERLLWYIEHDRAAAKAAGEEVPNIYAVCQNDNMKWCECSSCRAMAGSEKSYSEVLIDFMNYLAAEVKENYPDIRLATSAYLCTAAPPAIKKPFDNVLIVLCDTQSNGMFPHSKSNQTFLSLLDAWSKIAKNIRIWDYAVTYQDSAGLPYPSEKTYSSDFSLYRRYGVKQLFVEFEYPVIADARDYKFYLLAKFMENPSADFEKLSIDFAKRYYGPAWKEFLEYRDQLSKGMKSFISMYPTALDFSHLDLSMTSAIEQILNRGEKKVQGNKLFEKHWERLKIAFFRTIVFRKRVLMGEYFSKYSSLEKYPYDAEDACHRMQATEEKIITDMNLIPHVVASERTRMKSELVLAKKVIRFSIPERFHGVQGKVYVFEPEYASIVKGAVRVEKDTASECGTICSLFNPDPKTYALPFVWGIYDRTTKTDQSGGRIHAKDIFPGQYHWYKLGQSRLSPGAILYFFPTWVMQWNLAEAFDPLQENVEADIWANIKFDGTLFGASSGENGISVERIVVLWPR